MDPLIPFRATADDPWDADKAAHLARRAGFGSRPEEIEELVRLGPGGAVDRFVDFADVDQTLEAEIEEQGGELVELLGGEVSMGVDTIERIRRWWVYRMVHGRQPLQEKLTLLWHDHFACQVSKVIRGPLVLRQNDLFRRHAAGSFRELVRGVSRDPAMLVFLDNRLNERSNPNENWARELLELFTLGVDRYTQKDVFELARVFTGWSTPNKNEPEFTFRADVHDEGDKQFLGRTIRGRSGRAGMEEADEALEIVLAREECGEFVGSKLVGWFASHGPAPDVAGAIGQVLRESDWSIREALRALFRSAWFYAPENRFHMYKNPVELAVGIARALGVQNGHLAGFERATRKMGMQLFEPPSVAGWELGEGWVNSGSIVERFNFALDVSELPHTRRRVTGRPAYDVDGLAPQGDGGDAELVDSLALRLLQRPLPDDARRVVVEHLEGAAARQDPAVAEHKRRRARIRAAVHLILTTPEFALA